MNRPSALLTEAFERSAVAKAVARLSDGVPCDLVAVNAAFSVLTGWSAADLTGRPWTEHFEALTPGSAGGCRLDRREGPPIRVTLSVVQDGEYALIEVVDSGDADRFGSLFDASPICMSIADENGRLLRVNTALEVMLGRGRDELLGRGALDFTHPDDRAANAEQTRRLHAERGSVAVFEKRYLRPDGTVVWARVSMTAVPGPAGESHLLVQSEDVTASRHATEAAAAATEREVRRLRDTLAVQREVTAAAADRDGALRVVADRAIQLFEAADGVAVELLDGDELRAAVTSGTLARHTDSRLPVAASLSGQVLTSGRPAHSADTAGDPRVHDSTLDRLGIRSMLVAPLFASNRAIGCLKITSGRPGVFDRTDEQLLALLADSLGSALRHADDAARNLALLVERTNALDAQEAAETRFRIAFENSPLGLTLISLDENDYGRYLQSNPAMTALTGFTAQELGRMTIHDLVHPDDLPTDATVRSGVADSIASGTPVRTELRYRHRDGHPVWVSLCAAAVRDDYGRPLYLVNQVEDISARREVAAQVHRQARLLELIPAAVIVRDLDGAIRWWNAGAAALYHWPVEAAAGKNIHRLLGTTFPGRSTEHDQTAALRADGHWAGQLDHRTGTGRTVTVLSRQVLHAADGREQVLEINTDVTAARAAERALQESEQRFRAQFTHAATGQIVHLLDGTFGAVNPAFAAMLGRGVDDLIGTPHRDVIHPDDVAAGDRDIAGLFAAEYDAFTSERRMRHADGSWVHVSATVSIVRDADGRPRHLIGMVSDISDRRAAEQARDQAAAALSEHNMQLEAANKLKLDIIGMLGHEIGNPLSSIRGYAEVLADDWAVLADDQRAGSVDAIVRQAARLDQILDEVLAMVTLDAGSFATDRHDVPVLAEIKRALAAIGDERVPVTGPVVSVRCHPGHLQQILLNLLSNAVKYGGGPIGVTVTADGRRVRIRVVDAGPGVPEDFRPLLFDRLARAPRDAAADGTGLGLYIVRGLARANDGDVQYEPGQTIGSIFVVDLEQAGV